MTARRRYSSATPDLRVVDTGDHYPDWATLYADNASWVYSMIFRRVANEADVEDLTSEVFLAALRPLRITATVKEIRGYLRVITRTVLATYWRQNSGRQIASIDDVRDRPEPEQSLGAVPELIIAVLTALPDNYRRILELRFLHGFSVSESARQMGVSVGNAKVLQHRALRSAGAALREETRADRT
jgi:RNA polymerase sigma factor (sigma-70 family)